MAYKVKQFTDRARQAILFTLLTILILPDAIAAENEMCKALSGAVVSFIHEPTNEHWDVLSDSADDSRAIKCDCSSEAAVFHSARQRRDLPNSQALKDISPDQFVAEQNRILKASLRRLKVCKSGNLSLLIAKMKTQSFDPELIKSAIELENKLVNK